jgi:peptidoglycan/xylan/chitin deacetylase (PgdA/CDA1 family)
VILARHKVPALFFVSTRHVGSDDVMWFTYLDALQWCFPSSQLTFRGDRYDMSSSGRHAALERLKEALLALEPHPSAMYSAIADELPPLESFVTREQHEDWFAGMTEEQIAEITASDLFVVGCHTTDHPFLTRCSEEEELRQIRECKTRLERISGKPVTAISYPTGDYSARTIAVCRQLGFEWGYAVEPRLGEIPEFEIPRSGIYQAPVQVAHFKALWSRRRSKGG